MGTIDLGKAVMSNDDKEIKGATGKLIKRAIAAVAVFFVVTIVSVVMGWLGKTDVGGQNGWVQCWDKAAWVIDSIKMFIHLFLLPIFDLCCIIIS